MSLKEDAIVVGACGVGIFVLYQAMKNGLFGNGISDVLTGEVGARAGTKFYNTNLTPGYDVNDYTTYDASYGTGNKNLGAVLFSGKTPLEKLKELVSSGQGSVGVSATDSAFATNGLTTAQMECINNNYGYAVGNSIVVKLAQNRQSELNAQELDALVSVGWSGGHGSTSTLGYVPGVGYGVGVY